MSNPLINRWGFNLFWYNFWYTDKNNFLQNSLDLLMSKLVLSYVTYGILATKSIFFSFYWYRKINQEYTNLFKQLDSKYFRLMQHKSKLDGEISKFYVRSKKKDVYFSKVWMLRYQNWIVIRVSAFQPVKKLSKRKKKARHLSAIVKEQKLFFKTKVARLLRFKMYLLFFKQNYIIKNNLYYFF